MAGHSKWANIKHKKSRADQKKGKIFSRITKEIIAAVKVGGADPKSNTKLRLALQKAKAANLPNDNIERNIKKASSADQADYHESSYEIYGHGGVGIIVEALTDNKNRTAADIRVALNKCGGSQASPGSVAFNFDKTGVIEILKDQAIEEELFVAAEEAGAQDFEMEGESYLVLTDPSELYSVKEALEHKNFKIESANLAMLPKSFVDCDEEQLNANLKLIEWLEDLEDVDEVFHNARASH